MKSALEPGGLQQALELHPGLIPTAILHGTPSLVWTDLGRWHLSGGFLSHSLNELTRISSTSVQQLETALDALSTVKLGDTLEPSGFIFHCGRCGSTLLSTALARSRRVIAFCEADPHNRIWPFLRDRGANDVEIYRRLVLAMGRRRSPSYNFHSVKFTSWNVMEREFIARAFPSIPSLFLFRDPATVLASCALNPPPWLGRDVGTGLWHDPAVALRDFFQAAIQQEGEGFRCLDYSDLNPQNLPVVLAFLGFHPNSEELSRARSAFLWDAKSERPRRFQKAKLPEQDADSPPGEIGELYQELRNRARRFWQFGSREVSSC